MFTGIQNLFTPALPRQAEETDTHQYIQRHDPDQQRRRGRKGAEEDDSLNADGSITIAVEALRIFLEKTLQSADKNGPLQEGFAGVNQKREAEDYKIQQEMDLGMQSANPPSQTSAQAAHAASLYQAVSSGPKKRENILLETTDTASNGPEIDLSLADIRSIRRILEDIKVLSRHNIEYLHIYQAASFLESLENAISEAKAVIFSH